MGTKTKIEWADSTWSPWRGCTKVSPGCLNCYAETLAKRNPAVLGGWGKGAPRVLAKNWGDPMRRNCHFTCDCGTVRTAAGDPRFGACPVCESPQRKQRVFPSLCDWLDDEVSPAWLAGLLALINLTPNLDWLLLTKRPENWRKRIDAAALASTSFHQLWLVEWLKGTPPANVWSGVSVEDQTRAVERVPRLLEIPAALRWLSVEPMLGPVDLTRIDGDQSSSRSMCMVNLLTGHHTDMGRPCPDVPCIDWVVVGGESGPKARPCDVKWVRRLISDCRRAGVPVFVKQLGSRPEVEAPSGGWMQPVPVRHSKGGDPDEWPDELRVRQFPSLALR